MEIGGDFWKEDIILQNNINKAFFDIGNDSKFVMSGRTAIDIAIQDILKTKDVKNVYFPSYACESMCQSFKERNINIKFYNIYFDKTLKYEIDTNFECDIFFAMNYFGYTSTNMEEYIKEFKLKNTIVIEDITHSLFSNKKCSNYSDYVVASLRKWIPINCGGFIAKLNNSFDLNFDKFSLNDIVVNNKRKAMDIKYNSIKNNCIDQNKEAFLELYKKSNNEIKTNYINKLIDEESLNYLYNFDLDNMIKQRRKNANIIYKYLKTINCKFLINNYKEDQDCLLYVPIYLNNKLLMDLKKYIYSNKLYCPSHWPFNPEINNLFEYELSIVCDQRYNENQIKEEIEFLNKVLGEL